MLTFHDLTQFELLLKTIIYNEYQEAVKNRKKISIRELARKYKCGRHKIETIINDDSLQK